MQNEQRHSVSIAPIGYILIDTPDRDRPSAGSATPDGSGVRSTSQFVFSKAFVDANRLTLKHPDAVIAHAVSAIRPNMTSLARAASVDVEIAKMAFSHLFQRIGEVLATEKRQVLIDLGVGTLIMDRSGVDFVFHESIDPSGNLIAAPASSGPAVMGSKHMVPTAPPQPRGSALPPMRAAKWGGKGPDRSAAPTAILSPELALHAPVTVQVARGPSLDLSLNAEHRDDFGVLKHGHRLLGHKEHQLAKTALSPMNVIRAQLTQQQNFSFDKPSVEEVKRGALAAMEPKESKKQARFGGKPLPPVLDAFARTKSATFDDDKQYHSLTAKVRA